MKNVIERILNLLAFLLTVNRPVTAEEIRSTVAGYDQANDEAFRRMFERDKDLLRGMGIPMELAFTDAWEVEQGYVVPREQYELPDPGLTDEERTALWLAAQVVRLGGQPAGPEALLKLGGVPLAGAGEPLGADLGLAADTLGLVFQAVSDRRRLGFVYRDRRRSIHPYGLLHQRGHWYVVGASKENDEIRSYRVDRAREFTLGDTTDAFDRPQGFSVRTAVPSAPWEAGEEDVEATVVFDPDVAWWAIRQLPSHVTISSREDGSVEATLSVANPDAFIGWLLAFEEHAELVDPPALRDQLIARVRAAA